MYLILDAHEDLSINMMDYKRDYRLSSKKIQEIDIQNGVDKVWPPSLLGWEDWNRGRVGIVLSTLFEAPYRPDSRHGENDKGYKSIAEANQRYWRHPEIYGKLAEENPQKFRLIKTAPELRSHLRDWEGQKPDEPQSYQPIGLIQAMEGAEGISGPDELPRWWQAGVRSIGLAWAGNQYCGGTRTPGPLTKAGRELVQAIAEIGFCIDIAHLDEASAWDLFDCFNGPIIASHDLASPLVKGYQGNRLLSDEVIRALIEKNGVVGILPGNDFLDMSKPKHAEKSEFPLKLAIDQFDHICQLAGDAEHVGFGTDFDGGFGVTGVPEGINSIADLPKILDALGQRGYSEAELHGIASGNFLRVIESVLPD
ncbi:MAG: membrane dipeptidase [Anaerolineaceae bacterium]|nr:membrane dipeptidase [Anaerolineaceae bacterium]